MNIFMYSVTHSGVAPMPEIQWSNSMARRGSGARVHGGIGPSRHVTFPASDRRRKTLSHSRL